jgi:hypothetical protein
MKKARFFFVGLALMALTLVSCAQVSNSTTVMLSFDASSLARDVTTPISYGNDPLAEPFRLVVGLRSDSYNDYKILTISNELLDANQFQFPVSFENVPTDISFYIEANLYNINMTSCDEMWMFTGKSENTLLSDTNQMVEVILQNVDFTSERYTQYMNCAIAVNDNIIMRNYILVFFPNHLYCITPPAGQTIGGVPLGYVSCGKWDENKNFDADLRQSGSLPMTEYCCFIPSPVEESWENKKIVTLPKTNAIQLNVTSNDNGAFASFEFKSAGGFSLKNAGGSTIYSN